MKNFLLLSTLLFSLAIFLSCSSQRPLSQLKDKEIHHLEMVKIGGIKQAILINGKDTSNPVLLYLHGGPGFPLLPFEPFNESMRMLEKHFTVVYWEQRGTGKSYHPSIDEESMNVNQFVSDTREVVEYIYQKLGKEKIFLWGHSWGSNLGAIYASRYPETLHAYISTGQSANPFLNERLAYEFVLQRATEENNRRALRQLSRIDTLPDKYTVSDALTIRKWVYRYGGIVYQNQHTRPYVDLSEINTILSSPYYTWRVRINLLLNPYFSINTLWEDLKVLNLFEKAPTIEVPVYFLVGRHDIIVSHIIAADYFEYLDAPEGKKIIWFEKSAHRPFKEEREKFLETMLTIQNNHWEVGVLK